MKLSKKKVFVLALAVCLIATLSLGSLAWFTAEDSVTNDFMIGDTNTDPDKVFGIDLWEKVDADRDGHIDDEIIGLGAGNDAGAKYEAILPGEILPKEPYLKNTGIHPQYVRAIVTVTPASILKDAMADDWKNVDLFLAGTDAANWKLDSISYINDGENSKFVYVYYYQHVLAAGATTDDIFEAVVIPTGLTTDQAAQLEGFRINIVGQAIQSEHILKDNAKDAFETYWQGVPVYEGASDLYYSGDFAAPIVTPENQAYTKLYLEDANVTGEAVIKAENTVATIEMSNVSGTVDNVIVLEQNNTLIISKCNFTLPAGGKLVVNHTGAYDIQVILEDVYVNGVLITNANKYEYIDSTVANVWIYNN